MLDDSELLSIAQRLARRASSPARIVVFGSYARGDADERSDLDLLVVQEEVTDPGSEYLRLRDAIGRIGVGVDLILLSEEEFERRSRVPGSVMQAARVQGKVLHDSVG